MIHATEPYTQITWTPLAIRDPDLAAGTRGSLASTIDIAPTCLALLGIDGAVAFANSGRDLLADAASLVFSQNFTANQPDNRELGIVKAFAATDDTYNLLASSRGLELYAYRLDPGNHCNLLHFFDVLPEGRLALRPRPGAVGHFRAALQENPHAVASLASHFGTLRAALAERIAAKRAYIVARGVEPASALDPACLAAVDDAARAAFFRRAEGAPDARASMPPFDFSFKLG
jgi:hypothetical protein